MRIYIYILALALLLVACKDRGDYGENSSLVERSATSSDLLVHSIFPRTPMVAKGGSIALTAAVSDAEGYLLASTINDPIYIEWSSSDPNVATIDERGNVFGKNFGKTTITAIAKRGAIRSVAKTIVVNVVGINAVDIAELFFSPSQAYLDLNAKRKFRLSAVDHSGAASALSEGTIEFELSNDNIAVEPALISLKGKTEAVEIEATGVSKGFVFLTPIYIIDKGNEKVRVTGTPLAIQVKDPVETSKPTSTTDAGRYLSLAIAEDGTGFKGAQVMHYDQAKNELWFSDFYGTWTHSSPAAEAGKSAKMTMSPFETNIDKPMVVLKRNKKAVVWYQSRFGRWDSTPLSNASIVDDENKTYKEDHRLMDIVAFKGDNNSLVHAAYYDATASQVCMATLSSPVAIVAGTHTCVATNGAVSSVSIATNHTNGEPRLAYIVEEHTKVNDDNSTTHYPATAYYVTRQGQGIYREAIATQNDKISAKAKHIVIKLDRNNKPVVAIVDGTHIRVFSREKVGEKFSWQIDPVTPVDPFPTDIVSLDLALDDYNEPRLVYATVGEDGQRVRYAKQSPYINRKYRWVVETPALSRDGDQGRSVAIAVDSKNRAHLVYSLDGDKWFKYWAEPNFFNYQNYPVVNYSGADLITTAGRVQ